ncbi:hypothetical protein [Hyphomicrobium facile]|uniref:hypothetical protein n=1 Tax=Hyphomicrobium facile TaxID=51670 RepID=UPI0015A5BD80|nr:hypothetical protein [Hyphomicrobium facile]
MNVAIDKNRQAVEQSDGWREIKFRPLRQIAVAIRHGVGAEISRQDNGLRNRCILHGLHMQISPNPLEFRGR